MLKCDFNKVAKHQNTFPRNTSGWLLLDIRSFLQIQFIVFITEQNQHRIRCQRFGSNNLLKLKVRNLLMVLKEG